MANSNENAWPLIVIGGSSETVLENCLAFQEFPQVVSAKHFSKYAARPSSLSQLPFYIERVISFKAFLILKVIYNIKLIKAVRMSTYGRPGAVYIDLPGNFFYNFVLLII